MDLWTPRYRISHIPQDVKRKIDQGVLKRVDLLQAGARPATQEDQERQPQDLPGEVQEPAMESVEPGRTEQPGGTVNLAVDHVLDVPADIVGVVHPCI